MRSKLEVIEESPRSGRSSSNDEDNELDMLLPKSANKQQKAS
jgi:hypothetical protein